MVHDAQIYNSNQNNSNAFLDLGQSLIGCDHRVIGDIPYCTLLQKGGGSTLGQLQLQTRIVMLMF